MTGPADPLTAARYATMPPLATDAHPSNTYGQCARCQQAITPGMRIARLPDGDWIHVACVSA